MLLEFRTDTSAFMTSSLAMKPFLIAFASALLASTVELGAQTAEWVWHNNGGAKPAANEVRYFRRSFPIDGKISKAQLEAACDDQLVIFVNGTETGTSNSWKEPVKVDVTKLLKQGENVIAARGKNEASAAGLVVLLTLEQAGGKRDVIMTDRMWLSAADAKAGWEKPGFDSTGWTNVSLVAKLGAGPWGNVFSAQPASATPASEITVPRGFKVELLRSATPREGSWVSMAVDDRGRLYISPQGKTPEGGIMRVTLTEKGQVEKVDWLKPPVAAAMGMLWAFNSLYVSGQGPEGQAIYRLRDTDGDDQLDEVKLFKKVPSGAGEHGAHAIVLGPDQKLYIAHGNSTPLLEGIAATSPYRNYQEDYLLERILDPVATFFDKLKVPYGQVLRTDADGNEWELFAGGFRNEYDLDFNPDGELFSYDSDMEWDVGLPWYRPTRIVHVTNGADFGFREGSTKWPDYYPDSLASVVDVGLGSPTGVKFGTKSNFPAPYKQAFFAMDWTYGRILAVHLEPRGSSYAGKFEDFVKGKGLPVTDLEFGKDGAMYFTVGGRGTQAGLYRVSIDPSVPLAVPAAAQPSAAATPPETAKELRALRHRLEAFHAKENAQALAVAWPNMGHADRYIRFAARLAVERQPVAQWQERALNEKNPQAGLNALLALARCSDASMQQPLLAALSKFPLDGLSDALKLDKLRVIEVSFIRQGRPAQEMVNLAIEKLDRQFPAKSYALNHELSQLLVWLEAPDAVEKTLRLLESAEAPDQQIWFAYVLRSARTGWTQPQRERYFAWFNKARAYKGGNSFAKFIGRIKEQALAGLSAAERDALAHVLLVAPPRPPAPPPAVPRPFVKAWTMKDFAGDLDKVSSGRNLARGREIFATVQCLQCHKFGNDGGAVGPDLTAVASRFKRSDLLEAIIDPSKALSEQYASFIFTLKGGELVTGQIAEENNDHVTLITDPIAGTRQDIGKTRIEGRQVSPVSLMPPGLINVLTKEEVLDLLAYLERGPEAAKK
jgi:putative heme-binding domain-containing protein